MSTKIAVRLLAFSFIFTLTIPAFAHDYWLEREADKLVLYQGHKHSTHGGQERIPYDVDIVKKALCIGPQGAVTELAKSNSSPVRLDGGCASTFVQMSSGYWSQTLTQTVNKPRTEVSGALRGWRADESIKHLHLWSPRLLSPVSNELELVPLHNALELSPGKKLRLVAMWEGKPRSGVAVAYDGNVRGVTGDDGQMNILVRHGGSQIITASFESATKDPNASKVVRGTILQFEIRK